MNDRKRQVILTAQRLFLQKGFSATSLQDIIDTSKISKGTFYNYFSSKNEFLIAILEHANDEQSIRRNELLIGHSSTDKDIFAEQILIRMQVNCEYNLIPIFEAVFHSSDVELRAFIKKQHLTELAWLTSRLVDVYGQHAKPFAADCAVIMHGIMQHMMHAWISSSKEKIDTIELVSFTIRRIDSIISNMMESKDVFFGENGLFQENDGYEERSKSKEQLLSKLTCFSNTIEDEDNYTRKQYIHFLIDEITSEHPRTFLLESVTRSFREAFVGTRSEQEAGELASSIWKYVDQLKK